MMHDALQAQCNTAWQTKASINPPPRQLLLLSVRPCTCMALKGLDDPAAPWLVCSSAEWHCGRQELAGAGRNGGHDSVRIGLGRFEGGDMVENGAMAACTLRSRHVTMRCTRGYRAAETKGTKVGIERAIQSSVSQVLALGL